MIGKRSVLFWILCAAAVVVSLLGLYGISGVPDVLEYAVDYARAPQITADDEGKIDNALLTACRDFAKAWPKETVTLFTLKESAALNGGRGRTDTVTLYGVGAGYFEVYHHALLFGRYFDRTETEYGEKSVILNESAAFTLFGVRDAVGRTVTMGDREFTVAGVIRKQAGFLEAQAGVAYLPLNALSGEDADMAVLSLKGAMAPAAFEDAAEAALGPDGCVYSLAKEKLRARVVLRFLWIFFALILIPGVLRGINKRTGKLYAGLREKKKRLYAGRLLPHFLLFGLWCAAVYGLVLLCLYAVVRAGFVCAEVFTEFMPEDPTDWASVLKVARSVHGTMSRWRVYSTPLVRFAESCGRLCRAGAVICLLAFALPPRREKNTGA